MATAKTKDTDTVTTENSKGQVIPLNVRAREIMLPAMDELAQALPANIKPEKFQSAFVTAVVNNPEILNCKPQSIRTALMKCAADGLVPDGRKAAIVPFKGQAQYMPMAAGMIDRAAELGEAFSFTAECIYEADAFDANLADPEETYHRLPPGLFHERGEFLGVYAIFRSKEGRAIHRELMSKEDVDKARNVSRMKNAGPWQQWYSEMARKTVIRRGMKYIPVSSELRTVIERDDEHVDFRQGNTTPEDYNPLQEAPETIEGTTNELEEAIDNHEEVKIPPATKADIAMRDNMISTIEKATTLEALADWQGEMAGDIANMHPDMKADIRTAMKDQGEELRKVL